MTALVFAIAIAGWLVCMVAANAISTPGYESGSVAALVFSFLMITGAFAWATW